MDQPIFTHGWWDVYAILLFTIGPLVGLIALCRFSSTYRRVGLRKWRWALAAVLCNVLLVGPIFAVVYLVAVAPKIRAAKPRGERRGPSSGSRPAGGSTGPSGKSESQPRQEVPCGCDNGRQRHSNGYCVGGYIRIPGQAEYPCACQRNCLKCGGRGKVFV
jgi:hypothetical protein